jgi:ankyrin repeat protein
MSEDDVDELYRRLSSSDLSRPSDATRRAILAEAQRVAGARRARRWRPAALGTLAAAALAGVVMFPLLRTPAPLPVRSASPSPSASSAPTSPPQPLEEIAVTAQRRQARPPAYTGSTPAMAKNAPIVTPAPAAGAAAPAAAVGAPAAPAPLASNDLQFTGGALVDSRARSAAGKAAGAEITATATMEPSGPALRAAAAAGNLGDLQALLGRTRDLDAADAEGHTALMLAIMAGQEAAVSLLLDHGANPRAVAADGQTPLSLARQAGNSRIRARVERAAAR